MKKPEVKICCIQSVEDANLAIKHGASALGLVSEMPSGPGVIPVSKIAEIVSHVSGSADTFLLTSKLSAEEIINQHKRCRTTTIQLVDSVNVEVYNKLRDELPGIKIVQVIHVSDDKSVKESVTVSKFADAVLLDSGNQQLNVKELGGTGRTHDWRLSRKIVESVDVPVYLAGGLKPGNVVEAITSVQPYGLDLCSGVRKNGNLDEELLEQFFKNLNSV